MANGATGSAERYSTGAIWFHWIIALLVIVNLFIGLFHESLLEGIRTIPLHKAIGITVLVLTFGRIAWRLMHSPPPLPAHVPGWERAVARAVRWAFYALMLVMPLTGWAMVSNGDPPRPISWFGLFDVPFLPVSKGVSGVAHEAHEVLGLLFVALVALHVAAALRHQLVLRDTVLARMVPGIAPRG